MRKEVKEDKKVLNISLREFKGNFLIIFLDDDDIKKKEWVNGYKQDLMFTYFDKIRGNTKIPTVVPNSRILKIKGEKININEGGEDNQS